MWRVALTLSVNQCVCTSPDEASLPEMCFSAEAKEMLLRTSFLCCFDGALEPLIVVTTKAEM